MSIQTFGCFCAIAIISSVHGHPMCPATMRSSGKSIATRSTYSGRPVSDG